MGPIGKMGRIGAMGPIGAKEKTRLIQVFG